VRGLAGQAAHVPGNLRRIGGDGTQVLGRSRRERPTVAHREQWKRADRQAGVIIWPRIREPLTRSMPSSSAEAMQTAPTEASHALTRDCGLVASLLAAQKRCDNAEYSAGKAEKCAGCRGEVGGFGCYASSD
jgi:hypothetical protein